MKSLTKFFLFIFVLGLSTSCGPEELPDDLKIEVIGDSGDQEDVIDEKK